MIQMRVVPLRRGRVACGCQEAGEIAIADLVDGHLERVDPHAVDGLFFVAPQLAAHREVTRRDQRAGWGNGPMLARHLPTLHNQDESTLREWNHF
jgi:hypothetical protein